MRFAICIRHGCNLHTPWLQSAYAVCIAQPTLKAFARLNTVSDTAPLQSKNFTKLCTLVMIVLVSPLVDHTGDVDNVWIYSARSNATNGCHTSLPLLSQQTTYRRTDTVLS